MSAVGIIFSNIHNETIDELTRKRTSASIPFGGRYRLIDFALSNFVNANITSVIEYNLNNINSCLDTDLATTLLTYGTAYELYYLYEGEFKAKVINPLQGIAYRNVEGKAELFLYKGT